MVPFTYQSQLAFSLFGNVPVEQIRSNRHNEHKSDAIRALEEDTRSTKLYALSNSSKCMNQIQIIKKMLLFKAFFLMLPRV